MKNTLTTNRWFRLPAIMFCMICFTVVHAQSPYMQVSGTSTACTYGTASYSATIYNAPQGCYFNYSWTAVQNGSVIASGAGPSFGFSIGGSTSSISVSVTASGCSYYLSGSAYTSVTSSGPAPGTPTPITFTHVSGYLYDVATSSSGATSYEWTITGGTIQGSATGATVRVLANSTCQITAKVRAKKVNCGVQYSSYVTGTKVITAPQAPQYVSGPAYIYYGQNVTFSASDDPHDPGIFIWSLSDPGGALTLQASGGMTATVFQNFSVPTLKEAYVSVKRTSSCGTSATVTALTRYGNNSGRMIMEGAEIEEAPLTLSPNPVTSGNIVKVKLPMTKDSQPKKLVIHNGDGELFMEQEIGENHPEYIEVKGLAPGFYIVRVLNSKNGLHVEKLVVK